MRHPFQKTTDRRDDEICKAMVTNGGFDRHVQQHKGQPQDHSLKDEEEGEEVDDDIDTEDDEEEFLDDDDDDDEVVGGEEQFDVDQDDEDNDGEEDESRIGQDDSRRKHPTSKEARNTTDDIDAANKKQRKVHKLSLTTTEDFNEKLRKRGVLYVARIPPRMTPTKLKSLLSEFGVVTRVYLMEEDATVRKRRRKVGGSGSKRYVEGWVEMEDKSVAKRVAASLNNTPITNYKRSAHYGKWPRFKDIDRLR